MLDPDERLTALIDGLWDAIDAATSHTYRSANVSANDYLTQMSRSVRNRYTGDTLESSIPLTIHTIYLLYLRRRLDGHMVNLPGRSRLAPSPFS